ncbi:MAG: bifunctional phosphoribosyl-AMP cyclohydrolase/phosphoribosyl-ATP diphosphatase HisIE [Endomicrobium sp.]|jgi:phosphoribosyl-ATP pyrophosphohydrolase/phosphoribosyl-AMP cyclohydrolase|nr:bifunctional phosphoribosyl-AMP cyclohydrolase/phosphoribosyl-ATP diphosphatase HisIE [Endomicrobium sp.]
MIDFNKTPLIVAIIQDYKTREVLMLAYMNKESYNLTLEKGETYFYSRSRKKLWHKGEISGCVQKIKGMYLDCDGDALLILVEQSGVACHTGKFSCFFNEIISCNFQKSIIEDICGRILDRIKNPVKNSYTNYLFSEGIDKICKKVGEESSEIIIAAKNENKKNLIEEICDLIYHILVLMQNKDISLKDINIKLQERYVIEGNKKEERK